MPENESLDFGTWCARRWRTPANAAVMGRPAEEVADLALRCLFAGVRAFQEQIAAKGVTLERLIVDRASPRKLDDLLRQTGGHPYVQHFITAATTTNGTATEVLAAFLWKIWDTMSDQMSGSIAEDGPFADLPAAEAFLERVGESFGPPIEKLAANLAADPGRRRRYRQRRQPEGGSGAVISMSRSLLSAKPTR